MYSAWYNKEEMLQRNLFILVPKEEMDQQSSKFVDLAHSALESNERA